MIMHSLHCIFKEYLYCILHVYWLAGTGCLYTDVAFCVIATSLIELSTLLLYYRHEYNLLHISHHHQVSDYVNYSIIAANYLMNVS